MTRRARLKIENDAAPRQNRNCPWSAGSIKLRNETTTKRREELRSLNGCDFARPAIALPRQLANVNRSRYSVRFPFFPNLFRRFKNLNQYRISRYKMVITKEKSGSFSFSLPRKKSGKIRTDVPILSWPPSHSLCFLISTPSPFPRRFYRSWKLVNSQRRNPSWGKVRGGDTPLRCRVRGLFKERFVDSQHDKDISRLVVSCTLGWEAERNPSFRGPLRKDRGRGWGWNLTARISSLWWNFNSNPIEFDSFLDLVSLSRKNEESSTPLTINCC